MIKSNCRQLTSWIWQTWLSHWGYELERSIRSHGFILPGEDPIAKKNRDSNLSRQTCRHVNIKIVKITTMSDNPVTDYFYLWHTVKQVKNMEAMSDDTESNVAVIAIQMSFQKLHNEPGKKVHLIQTRHTH